MGILLLLFVLLVALIAAAEKENNPNAKSPKYVPLAAMAITICAVGGLATWAIVGDNNRRLRSRLSAFDEATKKYDIKNCGNLQLDEDYGLPLFHSESLSGCPERTLNAWLCGKWKNNEFAWLQGGQLIDPLFRTMGNNAALNVGLIALFGVGGRRANRLKRKGFDAIVFSEELALPDVVLGHYGIAETSYIKNAVQAHAHPMPGMTVASKLMHWGAVSDSRGSAGIYEVLADIANSRQCLIQVIGGRVVVFLSYFASSGSPLVGSLTDVERELTFAHTIFERLKFVAQPKNSRAKARDDQTAVAEAFKPRREFRPSKGKIVLGLCMMMLSGMAVIGAIRSEQFELNGIETAQGESVEPRYTVQVEAEVQKRALEPGKKNEAGEYQMARPWIVYSYAIDAETFQGRSALSPNEAFVEKGKAKTLVKKCKKGLKFKVWIDPDSPAESSLKKTVSVPARKLKPANQDVDIGGALMVAKTVSLLGFGLVGLGLFEGRRPKVVIPDFSKLNESPQPSNAGPHVE